MPRASGPLLVGAMPPAFLIIPCYNEASRLPASDLWALAGQSGLHLILVDDGSTDTTRLELEAFAAESKGRADVLVLARNGGRGEAVRAGLLAALERGASVVGFADADMSTPVE